MWLIQMFGRISATYLGLLWRNIENKKKYESYRKELHIIKNIQIN